MLRTEWLPETTRRVFTHLAQDSGMSTFTLIGGTALALQIGHRRSEDLDFWLSGIRLDKTVIACVMTRIRNAGFHVEPITPHSMIVASRINGIDLLAQVQDYAIDGAKVTFFARADPAYKHFAAMQRLPSTDTSFQIMEADAIFQMKAYVIHQRVRSRDLFDLKSFLQRGKTFSDILRAGSAADPACHADYAKAVLIGDVPLDKEDEGFESIGLAESISDVYAFFQKEINAYEQALAQQIRSKFEPGKPL